ncbi:MAG: hypothetical protein MZV64_21630 [Ignavibacteriales bacterium]|nr:hypothetical protein [Ignavibacteriales bacterium]
MLRHAEPGAARLEPAAPFDLRTFLSASAVLFSSFIGFDAIAQAGGEARNPARDLPLRDRHRRALRSAAFYFAFAGGRATSVVPWRYIAERIGDARSDGARGCSACLLSPAWTVLIVAGAAIALTNDLPAMILAGLAAHVRLGRRTAIFPGEDVARSIRVRRTPGAAIIASARRWRPSASIGSHLAGDFFLGVDLLVRVDARELPPHVRVGARAAAHQPRRWPPACRCSRTRASAPSVAVAGLVLLRALPRGACVEGPHRSSRGLVLPHRRRSGSRHGRRLVDLPSRGHAPWSALRGLACASASPRSHPNDDRPSRARRADERRRTDRTRAASFSIARVLTGLWQVADQERDGRALDRGGGRAVDGRRTPTAGFTTLRHGRSLRLRRG